MQTNKHTSGPWKSYLYGKDSQGRTIATVGANDGNYRICEISPYDLEFADVAANARLIAAAPDLLCMLERVLDGVLRLPEIPRTLCSLDIEQARKAIAKAKGAA
jgi:hypothetical protein